MHYRYYSTKLQVFQEHLEPWRVLVPEQVGVASPSHQKEKEKAGRLSCGYWNLLCGEKVALNVPHIVSRCASRRTTQDALAERAYANPATASQGEIPRTGHQRKEKHHPNLGGSKTGISSKMNIPTPCALKASFQIFGRGMRTHAHEGRERSVVKLRCLLNAYQSYSGYVRRVR